MIAGTLIDDKTDGHLVWETPEEPRAATGALPALPGGPARRGRRRKDPNDLMFTSARGRPMSNGNFRCYTFDPATKTLGWTA